MEEESEIVELLWEERCKHEDNRSLSALERHFYTLKAIICFTLGLVKPHRIGDDYICVAISGYSEWSTEDGTYYDWTEHAVGVGVLRNWHYMEVFNGS